MTTQPDPMTEINNALGPSMQFCISSMEDPDPRRRRGVDFRCIDAALAAAEGLVARLGPDTVVVGSHGRTASGLLTGVRNLAAQAEPFRPKARRA